MQDTRDRVIGAARSAFATHGYGGAGLRGIAADAGLSTMAIYTYAPSKAALYELVYADGIHQIYQAFAAVITESTTLADEVHALMRCGGALLNRDPDLLRFTIRVVLDREHPDLVGLQLVTPPYENFFRDLVRRNIERGELVADDGPALVRFVTTQLWGLTAMAAVDPAHVDRAVQVAIAATDGYLARRDVTDGDSGGGSLVTRGSRRSR